MATQGRERFVRWQVAWMVSGILALAVVGELTLERAFATSLIGLVVLVALVVPVNVSPTWRARLRWVVLGGLLAFGALLLRHVFSIIPSGLL